MTSKLELQICLPNLYSQYIWISNSDGIYPKEIIYTKPPSNHKNLTSFTLEFINILSPQRIELFGGNIPNIISNNQSSQLILGANNNTTNYYHHAIFNHIKTIYISPQKINPKLNKKMKVVHELEESQTNFQFFRILVFPTINRSNPLRICEISSVYLTSKDINNNINNNLNLDIKNQTHLDSLIPNSNFNKNSIKSSTLHTFSQQTEQKSNPFKSLFRRNIQIYVGSEISPELNALYSDIRTNLNQNIDKQTVENLLNNWHNSQKNSTIQNHQIIKYNVFEYHYLEIEWITNNINLLQKLTYESELEKNNIAINQNQNQRNIPYTLTSIQNLKKRLLLVLKLITNPKYTQYLLSTQEYFPSISSSTTSLQSITSINLIHKSPPHIITKWFQNKMSVQDIINLYYIHSHPLLKDIYCKSYESIQMINKTQSISTIEDLSLIQYFFIKLWIHNCSNHTLSPVYINIIDSINTELKNSTTIETNQGSNNWKGILFHFECEYMILSIEGDETDKGEEEEYDNKSEDNERKEINQSEMLFLLNQNIFFSSIQSTISSFSDFNLLFDYETYHFTPPIPSQLEQSNLITSIKNMNDEKKEEIEIISNSDNNQEKKIEENENQKDEDEDEFSDDSSIPDIEELVEQAISEFISKDGFEENSNDIIHSKHSKENVESHVENQNINLNQTDNTEDIQTKNQNQNKNKNKNKNQDSRRSANVIIPNFEHFENHIINEPNIYKVNERKKCSSTRKVRHILGLLSTLPKDIQLSSSYSIELQIYKVSESLISSSIIALHHFLKYDSRGQFWFETINFVKRIHSGDFIHGGTITLMYLDYSIILYSLLLIIPAIFIGRVHIMFYNQQINEHQNIKDFQRKSLYSIRSFILYLSSQNHIQLNFISAILTEILSISYNICSYTSLATKSNFNSIQSYLNSLLPQQLISKQKLCNEISILCFECLDELILNYSFQPNTRLSKEYIEKLVSEFQIPHIDCEVQEAALKLGRRCNSHFPKYLVEFHLKSQEMKKNYELQKLEELKKEEEEQKKREEDERKKKEKEDNEQKEIERLEKEKQDQDEIEKKLLQEKEEKYAQILKKQLDQKKKAESNLKLLLIQLQEQREELDRREREAKLQREKELQEEYEKEKEKRLQELNEIKENEAKKRIEQEEKEKEERKRKEEEEKERKRKEEEEKEKQRKLIEENDQISQLEKENQERIKREKELSDKLKQKKLEQEENERKLKEAYANLLNYPISPSKNLSPSSISKVGDKDKDENKKIDSKPIIETPPQIQTSQNLSNNNNNNDDNNTNNNILSKEEVSSPNKSNNLNKKKVNKKDDQSDYEKPEKKKKKNGMCNIL